MYLCVRGIDFDSVAMIFLLDLQPPIQSMLITTNNVIWNPAHDKVYSIQHYVIKFVSDLRQVSDFLRVFQFPVQIKLAFTI